MTLTLLSFGGNSIRAVTPEGFTPAERNTMPLAAGNDRKLLLTWGKGR